MNTKFVKTFVAARRVSTPILAVETPEPASTIALIAGQCTNNSTPVPVVIWDVVRGFWTFPKHQAGIQAIAILGAGKEKTFNPVEALFLAEKFPQDTILFVMNAHQQFSVPGFTQAVWNLRDLYKQDQRTCVLLGPSFTLPAEIVQDVVTLSEPLPDSTELSAIVRHVVKNAQVHSPGLKDLDEETVSQCVDAVSGLSAFVSEQVFAMSLTKNGVDLDSLWDRKRKQIEQTRGLSVWSGKENLDDVKDADNLVSFLERYLENTKGILFMDEIADVMAGSKSDSSGVAQKMHGTLLSWMEDREACGILLIGFPGTGKSMSAKAAGSRKKKPVVKFDMAQMEDSLVGASNMHLTNALKTVDAVMQGKVLVIATCNDLSALSPQLRSRFRNGTFFFDLPSSDGRKALWKLYRDRYNVPKTDASRTEMFDNNWTGREIKTCCELSRDLNCTLLEASGYIVPIARHADNIDSLRKEAETNNYISASKPGFYQIPQTTQTGSRSIRIE